MHVHRNRTSPSPSALMVHPKSWLTPLPDNTFEIHRLLERHNQRVLQEDFNPQSSILSEIPTSTLINESIGSGLKAFTKCKAGQSFTGVVQITATSPAFDGKSLRPFCRLSKDRSCMSYQFAVTLADKSTSVVAFVDHTVGETIVGIPAEEALNGGKPLRAELIDATVPWVARLVSVDSHQFRRFFVLVDLVAI